MIRQQTTLLLGAGASVPYGFPTGSQLREQICAQTRRGFSTFALLEKCGKSEAEIESFRHDFQRSAVTSIDAFIAFRPEYQEVGELSIAATLLPIEHPDALYKVEGRTGYSGWYQALWAELLSGVRRPEDLLSNAVSIVTFNYDRSLEQFLFGAIAATFALNDVDALSLLGHLRIRHIYGTLGPFNSQQRLPYGKLGDNELARAVADARSSILTIPSVRGSLDEVAASWLANSDRVFALGFGFDPMNCERIALKDACSSAKNKTTPRQFYASAFNLTTAEMRRLERNATHQGQGGLIWSNGDCLKLLRERIDELA